MKRSDFQPGQSMAGGQLRLGESKENRPLQYLVLRQGNLSGI
jgi:hypothetical protein